MLGKPRRAWSARRPGWRVTPSAAAALNAVAPMVAMPLVALAQTSSAEPEFRHAASHVRRRRHGVAGRGQVQRQPDPRLESLVTLSETAPATA